MKITYILCLKSLICLLFFSQTINAYAAVDPSINQLYMNFYNIVTDTNETKMYEEGNIAVNYAVEILKKAPNSLEAYYTVDFLRNAYKDKKVINQWNKLKEKHMPNIDDPNFEPAEKLIFVNMLMASFMANSIDDFKENIRLTDKILDSMKENCQDKNYAALAMITSLKMKKIKRWDYMELFTEKFPEHSIIPLMKMNYIYAKYVEDENDNQKCIEELFKLVEKYKNTISPNGWRIAMSFYNQVAFCYINLNDIENARKYYNLIKSEAPDYSNLSNLEDALKSVVGK